MTQNEFGLLVIDYENDEWLRVIASEVERIESSGKKVLVLRLARLNVPARTTLATLFVPLHKILRVTQESVFSPRKLPSSPKVSRFQFSPETEEALEAQLRGYFRSRFQIPEKARRHLLHGGVILQEALDELFRSYKITEVSLPNGRLFLHKIIESKARLHKVPLFYTEIPVFDPKRSSYFLEPFTVHDRIKLHKKYSDASTLQLDFNEEKKWFGLRRESQSENPFLKSQKNFSAGLEPSHGLRTIALFSSSPDEFLGLEFGDWGCAWTDQYHGFEALLARMPSNCRFVLRLHPNLTNKSRLEYEHEISRARYLQAKFPKLTIIGPSAGASSYALVRSSELVVVSQSTLGLESVAMGIPTVSVMPTIWDLNLGVVRFHFPESVIDLDTVEAPDPILALRYLYFQYSLNNGRLLDSKGILESRYFVNLSRIPSTVAGFYLGRRIGLFLENMKNRRRGRFIWHGDS